MGQSVCPTTPSRVYGSNTMRIRHVGHNVATLELCHFVQLHDAQNDADLQKWAFRYQYSKYSQDIL